MRSFYLLLLLIPNLCSATPLRDTLPPSDYFTVRNGLPHALHAITVTKSVTVAFLGGSITYNPGWRDKTCTFLQEKFPTTHFHFIAAGIPSLGSLPHAFRLQRDVLDSGKVDLLFVETAVNDRVNGTDSLTQIRALEGIVRHAKKSNPSMDILFMSFADPSKTEDYEQGKIPPEVANHERIAGYYGFPSINLAKEVHDKIAHQEFSWKKDFKDIHPSPFGQELYFAAIRDLLNICLDSSRPGAPSVSGRSLPPPLDKASLVKGAYYNISNALVDKDWEYNTAWRPRDSLATRPGFVGVPMLVSTTPGATLTLPFKGTAIGMAVISGADAGILSWSVDEGPYQKTDLYTAWSSFLHLPWYILFRADLKEGPHQLKLTIDETKNPRSRGTACRIVYFLVNR
ncbi:MAG TPA: SGNH/GDSL hydrolase family protein [Puia sp.]|nr:SGNH/GDSL hydrolase family protein [Puia sp.]